MFGKSSFDLWKKNNQKLQETRRYVKEEHINEKLNNFNLKLHSTRELDYLQDRKESLYTLGKECDWYINEKSILKLVDTKEPKTIFINSRTPKTLINFTNNVLPNLNHKFVIVVAGYDWTWPLGLLDPDQYRYHRVPEWQDLKMKLIDNPNVVRIFVENLDMDHPKLEPIPLGMCFARFDKYYHQILNGEIDINYDDKDIECLSQHNIHWKCNADFRNWYFKYADDRIKFNELLKKEPLNKLIKSVQHDIEQTMYGRGVDEFKTNVLKSTFLICIHGGGLDPCPKVWEGILLGAIPIIKKSTVSPAFKDLPVVVVDEFDEKHLTQDNFDKWWDDLSPYYHNKDKRKEVLYKLSTEYWINHIKSFVP
jgi:hypothetical protein